MPNDRTTANPPANSVHDHRQDVTEPELYLGILTKRRIPRLRRRTASGQPSHPASEDRPDENPLHFLHTVVTSRPADASDQGGTVTAFVACFTIALLVVAGLVIDGGFTLAARRRAFNEANAAARAGAQAIDEADLRSTGHVRLRSGRARSFALDHLTAAGLNGAADVEGDTVTVRVTTTQDLTILGMVGLGPFTIRAEGSARAVQGVRTGGD